MIGILNICMMIRGQVFEIVLDGTLANKLSIKRFGSRVEISSYNGVKTLSNVGALNFWDDSGSVDDIH